MTSIINYLNKKSNLDSLVNSNKIIHCENDESFAFYAYYKYINSSKSIVIVLENFLACQNLYNKLSLMLKDKVYMYCVDEITKYTSLATSPELMSSRLFVLNKLLEDDKIIVLTHTMAIKRLTPSVEIFKHKTINIKIDDKLSMNDMILKMVKLGYKSVYKVTQPFEFSTRGGVIDIYSINYDNPIRIEFFDEDVESIRFFNIESQRTISTINNVKILPATEFLFYSLDKSIENIKKFSKDQIEKSEHNLQLESIVNEDIEHLMLYDFNESLYRYYFLFESYCNFSSYIKDKQVIIVNDEKIKNNELFIENEMVEENIVNYEEGNSLKDFILFETYSKFKAELNYVTYVSNDITNKVLDLNYIKVDTFDFNFELLYKKMIELLMSSYYIYIGLSSKIHYNSLKQFFLQKELSFNEIGSEDTLKKGINISNVDLNIGLDFVDEKLYVIGENEIFKQRFKSSISQFSKYKNAVTISSVNELNVGDYLVHDHYGIGIYKGIETMLNNGIHRDYIKIEYKNQDILYLPLEQFKLVRKYVSKEGVVPKIHRLGSKEWEKTKTKINERVNEIAEKLVELYSNRAQKKGFSFSADDELQLAFENDFGYELTYDQQTVLNEIKQDMQSELIMDRLLVGDVGFGKTEIAFRAAFKAVLSGKQVAMLCPTTLLARQHYLTAIDRFKNYGVNICLLSRLVSEKETESILKRLADGKVDIIIGTHRLLSKDVTFKDLGLLVVDEEHKFGVEHKEKIKEIKQSVDVLTLSATPIPRTLQMALTGVRGFSTINTPIENRMPVQTYVIKKDKIAIKEIIERELSRGGQVFYLNNKIEKLPSIAHELTKLVKNAKVAIAHGKLGVEQMEDIMQRFINNEFNILLCTTIIENGIDIPNVNTIIVENADCFGLSQLYQIKGRVGRSNKLAYAYLMYNPNKDLSDIAKKRLQTIKEFTALGSGYKVAMRDLITRGAGDLLGPEQSGFIESVGIDMYIEMLHRAINNKKAIAEGKKVIEEEKASFNKVLQIDAYIPSTYFTNDYEKIDLYKQIDKVKTIEELVKLKEEIVDKTGKLPDSINMLFEKKMIDLFENKGVIENYNEFDKFILITLSKDFMRYKGIGVPIFDIACKVSNTISLKFKHDHIEANIKKTPGWIYVACEFIAKLDVLKHQYEKGEL